VRKKLFEIMNKEEFMYTMQINDYKYIFEYDDIDDLNEQLAITKATHREMREEEAKYQQINNIVNIQDAANIDILTFAKLELLFLKFLKEDLIDDDKEISKSSYKAYANTFNKLKNYFGDEDINSIGEARFKAFRVYLKKEAKLDNKTINIQIIYLNKFLNVALKKKLILENNAKEMKKLKVVKLEKENFTKEDIKNIFKHDYENEIYNNIFKILAHSGMRISELYNLTSSDIKKDENDIYYFNVVDAKTESGNRKIPIHKAILGIVLDTKFPISSKTSNAFNKEVLARLYKVIDKNLTKSIHTFRANFIGECINNYPSSIEAIQDISGHSQGSKDITINTYGKGFKMKLKKEIVDSVQY
jgi:integrase